MIEALLQTDLVALASHYAVVLMRVSGIFLFLPIFGSNLLPIRVRLGMAAVLAFVFLPIAPRLPVPPGDAASWIVIGVREISAGLALGIAAKVLFAGIEVAAGMVAGQSGFSLAHMVDPTSGENVLAPAIFMNLLAIAVFLAADLHHLFVLAIDHSYQLLPPAVELPDVGSLDRVVGGLGLRMFGIAAELAAPALIVTVSIDVVMVLVGKAMPQVPILFVAYPFKMAAAFVALAMLSWAIGSGVGLLGRTMASDSAAVMSAFAGT